MEKINETDEYWQPLLRFSQQILIDSNVLMKCEKCQVLLKISNEPGKAQELFKQELKEHPDVSLCFNHVNDMNEAIIHVFGTAKYHCNCNNSNKSE